MVIRIIKVIMVIRIVMVIMVIRIITVLRMIAVRLTSRWALLGGRSQTTSDSASSKMCNMIAVVFYFAGCRLQRRYRKFENERPGAKHAVSSVFSRFEALVYNL